jgi:sterol 3beta-glucosyltransferase
VNIAILTIVTQGDVQPFVALGVGLREAGHEVSVVTGKGFEALITERGLRHAALDVDLFELMQTPEGKASLAGKNLLGTIKFMPTLSQVLDEEIQAEHGVARAVGIIDDELE